ncbi:MAG: type IV pilus biogenesis/stability protein PilW [Gammaproteobacteria bacterium]|nr:type IV pilus biogenesis/stability protein PilW [Gammaproteobacteria bacterium]MBV9621683.1 type IV pilus biogenesis/stability protein PilW [Gammaproteobacteria bacterium]
MSKIHPELRLLRPLAVGIMLLLSGCGGTPTRGNKPHDAAAANTQLGSAYLNQGELALAKEKLDKAVAQDPNNPEVHSVRALLFERMGTPDKADAEFRAALRLAPHDPNVINNYAVYLCQHGRTDEGVKRFEEAARNALYRTPEAAYTNAGVCLRAAKRDADARLHFAQALQLRPTYGEAVYQLADMDFQQRDLQAARTRIDAFLNGYSETPDLLLLGVRVARAQNDRIGAQRYARKLQLNFPGTEQTRALATLDSNPG